jgi:hypothetical protein
LFATRCDECLLFDAEPDKQPRHRRFQLLSADVCLRQCAFGKAGPSSLVGDESSLSAGFGVRKSFIPEGGCFGASADFGFDDVADHFLFVGLMLG